MKLKCNNLACDRGGRRVFSDVSFEVGSGEALVVRGPNGAGKTSLLRVVAGLISNSGGSLTLENKNSELTISEHCHYFGHLDALKSALSVSENLGFWASFYEPVNYGQHGTQEQLTPQEALRALGIEHTLDLPAAYLSAGQRRRLSLARLLVVPRPIWVMDEPTAALDAASEQNLLQFMKQHTEQGGLLLAATHLPLNLPNVRFLDFKAADPMEDGGADLKDASSTQFGDMWL